ncbi:hypothetical protein [Streptomyces longwoodensis]|uniref:hypothetical protein n=1 Tax=Streptomyces longwoodensis TaxID=68231 RepID=UPI003850885F
MGQGRVTRARRWWVSAPAVIRRSTLVLLVLGSALVCTGLWLDHIHGWTGHEFLINLVSSLTSLCFGVPAALLVFSHLGNAQEEARQKERARAYATHEVQEFKQTLLQPFSAADLDDLVDQASTLRDDLRSLRLMHRGDPRYGPVLEGINTRWNSMLPGGPEPRDELASMERWRHRVQNQWKILNDEVRPRAVDFNLPWLPTQSNADAGQAVNGLFTEEHFPWSTGEPRPSRAAYFCQDLIGLCAAARDLTSMYS